ncbi:MAG: hypothetical protein GF384_08200, partial [Elusimicrobia bacterium]|nr:hypothetical protein [Elusimicrobiota bacterium]
MLILEALNDQARSMNLPLTKQRAIVREYIQTIILKALFNTKFGHKIFFMGGTALRFAYDLPRFSEDLDFNAKNVSLYEFRTLLHAVQKALENEGFIGDLTVKHRKSLIIGKISLSNALQYYKIAVMPNEKLLVKVEINTSSWPLHSESSVINKFGYLFTAKIMDKGSLLAEKSDAFINRCLPRDIYDLVFLLQHKFPFNESILKKKGWKNDYKYTILKKIGHMTPANLLSMARQIQPFLIHEDQTEFI